MSGTSFQHQHAQHQLERILRDAIAARGHHNHFDEQQAQRRRQTTR
jgi:hypothetical protein